MYWSPHKQIACWDSKTNTWPEIAGELDDEEDEDEEEEGDEEEDEEDEGAESSGGEDDGASTFFRLRRRNSGPLPICKLGESKLLHDWNVK